MEEAALVVKGGESNPMISLVVAACSVWVVMEEAALVVKGGESNPMISLVVAAALLPGS